jgi:hypothetical protein
MGVMKLEIVLQYSHSNQFSIGILVGTFGEGAGKINGIARYFAGMRPAWTKWGTSSTDSYWTMDELLMSRPGGQEYSRAGV